MRPTTLLRAFDDPRLFKSFFRDPETWSAWRVCLKAMFGLKLTESETTLFQACTGRSQPMPGPVSEAWFICGRRSGKSYIAALLGVWLACFKDYSAFLSPGERASVVILACDRGQAATIFRYARSFIEGVPMLARMVLRATTEEIELDNGVTIEIRAASFRGVRGRTIAAVLADEISFWRSDESANPDFEVLAALRPGMLTIPGAMLIGLSSPYAKRGVLYEAFTRHHGQNASSVLVWKSDTLTMNPSVSAEKIAEEYENDPVAAASEYGADFRTDIQAFLDEGWISSAIDAGCHERPAGQQIGYHAFVDPSGGRADSYTVAVAHRESDKVILDLAREFRAPLDPAVITGEIAQLLKPYRIDRVTGDHYGAEWTAGAFKNVGLRYLPSELTRSEIYLEVGPLLAQSRVRLLDNQRLSTQLRQLERRTSLSGKDTVNHGPGGHDDLANAVAGALHLSYSRKVRPIVSGPRPMFAAMDYDELNYSESLDKPSKQRVATMREPYDD